MITTSVSTSLTITTHSWIVEVNEPLFDGQSSSRVETELRVFASLKEFRSDNNKGCQTYMWFHRHLTVAMEVGAKVTVIGVIMVTTGLTSIGIM